MELHSEISGYGYKNPPKRSFLIAQNAKNCEISFTEYVLPF
jgi:hypothetical protein